MSLRNKPCPCGGICSCHQIKESKENWPLVIFGMFMIFVFPWFLIAICSHPDPVRHIEVNGKDCIVKTITDFCSSHGGCQTHDVAECPK